MPAGSSTYVVPVDRSEYEAAGALLARAVHDSEQWSAVLPDPDVRRRKLEQMFTGTLALTAAAGGVAERTEGMEAVALWLPPGRDIGFRAMVRSGFASVRFAVTPPFPNLRQLTAMFRQFDTTRNRLMPAAHWYLMALGVDLRFQRFGYGPLLVRHGVARADDDCVATYVESEAGPNVTFYGKLGFEELERITIAAYDLPFTVMARRPAAAPPDDVDTAGDGPDQADE